MHARKQKSSVALGLVIAAALFTGCGNGGGGNDGNDTPSGQALAADLIRNNTTDSAEPIEVNDLDLQFSESEGAFSSFFQ